MAEKKREVSLVVSLRDGFSATLSKLRGALTAPFAAASTAISAITAPLTKVETLVTGLVAALGVKLSFDAFKGLVEDLDASAKAAQRLGLTAVEFEKLKFAAKSAGVDAESLGKGLKELQLRATEFARTGGGPAASAFRNLNISVRDLNGNLKPATTLLPEIANVLAKLPTQGDRIRVATQILGKSGVELLTLLQKGGGALSDALAEVDRLAPALANATTFRNAQKISDAFDRIGLSVKGVAASIVEIFGPDIEKVLDSISNKIARFGEILRQVAATIKVAFQDSALGKEAREAIGAFLDEIVATAGELGFDVGEAFFNAFLEVFFAFLGRLPDLIGAAFKIAAEAATQGSSKLSAGFFKNMRSILQTTGVGLPLLLLPEDAKKKIDEFGTQLAGNIEEEERQSRATRLANLKADLAQTASLIKADLATIGPEISKTLDGVGTKTREAFNRVAGSVERFLGVGRQYLDLLKQIEESPALEEKQKTLEEINRETTEAIGDFELARRAIQAQQSRGAFNPNVARKQLFQVAKLELESLQSSAGEIQALIARQQKEALRTGIAVSEDTEKANGRALDNLTIRILNVNAALRTLNSNPIRQLAFGFADAVAAASDFAGTMNQIGRTVGVAITDGIAGAIREVITTTKSAKEVFRSLAASVLADIGQMLIRLALANTLISLLNLGGGGGVFNGVVKFLGGFAVGGRVPGANTGRDDRIVGVHGGEFMVRERYATPALGFLSDLNAGSPLARAIARDYGGTSPAPVAGNRFAQGGQVAAARPAGPIRAYIVGNDNAVETLLAGGHSAFVRHIRKHRSEIKAELG